MLHPRLVSVSFMCLTVCLSLSGCRGGGGGAGGGGGSVTRANFDTIVADGSEDLAAAEAIMGGHGTELPKEAWKKHDINPNALPFRKGKRVKGDDNKFTVVADDNGSEAKVLRWGDDNEYIYVAVLEDKVVFKGMKGN
jgi:hypothetical protein